MANGDAPLPLRNFPRRLLDDRSRFGEFRTVPNGTVIVDTFGGVRAPITQFSAGFARTIEGKKAAFETEFGKGNVEVLLDGSIVVKPPGSDVFLPANDIAIGIQDAPQLLGEGIGAVSEGIRSLVTFGLTQGQQGSLPEIGTGFASDKMTKEIGKGLRTIQTTPLEAGDKIMRFPLKQAKRDQGLIGRRRAIALGEPLTFDEFARGKEGANLFTFHRERRAKAERRLTTAFGELAQNPGDPKRLEAIAGDLNTVVGSIVALQRFDASNDFGQADRMVGGPAIRPVKLLQAIQGQIDRFDAPGASAEARLRVEKLTKLRDELIDDNGAKFLTAQEVNERLQRFGAARYGGKPIVEGFAPPQSRGMAGAFEDALVQDVETTRLGFMGKGEASDNAALALFEANSSYQFRQREIRETFNSALAKLTGNRFGSTEALAVKFFRGDITAPELRTATTLLLGAAPGEARKITCLYIENALELGKSVPDDKGVRFKADDFAASLPDAETLGALGVTKQDIAGMRETAASFQRIADQTIADPNGPTGALGFDPTSGAFTLPDDTAPQVEASGGFVIGLPPQMVADAMLTGEGRQSFGVLADPNASPEAVSQSTANVFAQFDPPPQGIRMPSIFIPSPDQPQTLDQVLSGP